MGNVREVYVHAANQPDTMAGTILTDPALGNLPTVRRIFADRGDRGTFLDNAAGGWGVNVQISQRVGKGFQVETGRWVAERTFGWCNGTRRLRKDYGKPGSGSRATVWIPAPGRALKHACFSPNSFCGRGEENDHELFWCWPCPDGGSHHRGGFRQSTSTPAGFARAPRVVRPCVSRNAPCRGFSASRDRQIPRRRTAWTRNIGE